MLELLGSDFGDELEGMEFELVAGCSVEMLIVVASVALSLEV